MPPTHRAVVLLALACGFLALSAECLVKIVRGFRMTDHNALAALCLAGAVALIMWIVFVHARAEPREPLPVRLDDKKTWRRHETSALADWGFYLGFLIAGAIIAAALAVA